MDRIRHVAGEGVPRAFSGHRLSGAGWAALVVGALFCLPLQGEAQRGPMDPCSELVEAARGGRTMAEMQRLIEAKRPDERILTQCGEVLQRDPQVAEVVRRDSEALRATALQQAQRISSSSQRPPEQLAINRRVVLAREAGAARMRLFSSATPPADPPPAPVPAIGTVTPANLVPGTDLVIEGSGFGNNGGTVRLRLQGMTFTATVNQWTPTWISAYLNDQISGVTESNGAVLEIQPQGEAVISRVVPFIPLYESTVINDLGLPIVAWPLPGEHVRVMAEKWSLGNHWEVTTDPWTSASGGIECEIDGPPVANPGNANLATRVRVAWGWFQLPSCLVYFEIQGPKGFQHGLW